MSRTNSYYRSNNAHIQKLISLQVLENLYGENSDVNQLNIGKLEQNYYSYTFPIEVKNNGRSESFFIKIPKVKIEGKHSKILPISSGDRQLALNEKASLELLDESWISSDKTTEWVKLVDFVPKYNALVTKRIFGKDALSIFRELSLLGKVGLSGPQQKLNKFLFDFGRSLGSFHAQHSRSSTICMKEEGRKVRYYCDEIQKLNGCDLEEVVMFSSSHHGKLSVEASVVSTLKGIDVRNFIIDESERIHLLDPGYSKVYFPESDLARFILTLRILFWGSPLFLFTREVAVESEVAFLDGYRESFREPDQKLFNFLLLKEMLKHWHVALLSLNDRNWPRIVSVITRHIYVDRFYQRQVRSQVKFIRGALL